MTAAEAEQRRRQMVASNLATGLDNLSTRLQSPMDLEKAKDVARRLRAVAEYLEETFKD